jgi:hypothetical protein
MTDLRQAAQQPEPHFAKRWNIERDGGALLICFGDHEKGDGCRFTRYVEQDAQPAPVAWTHSMTLHDWFAGQALMGLVNNYYPDETNRSEVAYQYADAMIAAREVKP